MSFSECHNSERDCAECRSSWCHYSVSRTASQTSAIFNWGLVYYKTFYNSILLSFQDNLVTVTLLLR